MPVEANVAPAGSVADDLWARYASAGDPGNRERIRERLVAQYAPLVRYVAGRLAISLPAVLDSDDVVSYGTMGLLDAMERFDPSRGIKFESYAIPRVRGAIIDALRSFDPVSRTAREQGRDIGRALAGLHERLGRAPTEEEVSRQLGISVDRYRQMRLRSSVTVLSLDRLLSSDEETSAPDRHDFFEDRSSPAPQDVVEQRELLQRLVRDTTRLPKREQLVLSLYYVEELTMKEISRVLEISESRVCQLHSQAIQRLKALLGDHLAAPLLKPRAEKQHPSASGQDR